MRLVPTTAARRGSALVLVLVFGLAVSALVLTLLSVTRAGVQQEFDQHRHKELHAVLKAGIAAAVNEINRERREGPAWVDPEGNGPGAVGVTAADKQGVAVRAPGGQLLGRYRAVVERGSLRYGPPARDLLIVAAAWPDFAAPRRLMAAEVELFRARLPFPAHALDLIGNWDKTKKFLPKLGAKNDLIISAPDADVPAVNITDPDLWSDFVADLVPEIDVLEGADPANPGTLVSGAATVTNDDPGVLNEVTLQEIRQGIEDFVASALPTATVIDDGKVPAGTSVTLPNGTYTVGKWTLANGTTLTGSGTLIVTDDFRLQKDGRLEWDGNIIVIDDAKAGFKVDKDAAVTLTNGVLTVISEDADAKLEFKKDSLVTLGTPAEPAALAIIAGSSNDKAKFTFKKDEQFTVNGIITVMASKKNEIKFDKDALVDITGSLVIALDGTATKKTELKLEIKKDSRVSLTFERTVFDRSLDLLGQFFDPGASLLPLKATTYWERPATQVTALQEAVMAANPPAEWGMP